MLKITTQSIVYSLLCVFLFACKKKNEDEPAKLLEKGIQKAIVKNYDSCIFHLSKIDDISPYSEHSKTGMPVLVYCHYMLRDYEQIHSMVESYESLYPSDSQLPYMHYLSALSYFRQIRNHKKSLLIDDKLLLEIQRVNEIAPYSPYAENLNKLLPFIAQMYDSHTLDIAQFYAKTNNYISSAQRYSTLYRETSSDETKKIVEKSIKPILLNMGINQEI